MNAVDRRSARSLVRAGRAHAVPALFLTLSAVVACGSSESIATAPSRMPLLDRGTDAVQTVTGHADFYGPATRQHWRQSFSAIKHADGSVSGEFEEYVEVEATGEFVRSSHGTVTCLKIEGNTARLGGVTDRASDTSPVPEGWTDGFITVVDNGEGPHALPDRSSPARGGPPGTAATHCLTGLPRPLLPLDHGNIQVRP